MNDLDLFSEDFQQRPLVPLAIRRHAEPVSRASNGWFVVTTMALVRAVLTDTDLYSNAVSRRSLPPPEVADEVAAIRAQGPPSVPTLLLNDPPKHTRYRRMTSRAFTPRALTWMEPLVAQVADELAAALPTGRTIDFIDAFARPLPVWAISRVLGLGDERRDDVRRWTDAATATIGAQLAPERWPAVERDMLDLQLTLADELARRRSEPREDLLTLIVEAADADDTDPADPVGTAELVSMTRELMVAGNESTLRLLADIVWQLDRCPDEWKQVRADPGRADAIVEEALRMASPSAAVFRRVTRDTTLGGVPLPAGSQLVLSLLSANRDDAVFLAPDEFDADRAISRHVAFGQGIHTCIGAGLARIEARQAVRALARHAATIEVDPDAELRYLPSVIVRGLEALPVRVRAD